MSKHGNHLKWLFEIENSKPCDMPIAFKISYAFNFQSENTISWIFLIILGVVTSNRPSERWASLMLLRPQRNLVNHIFTFDIIELSDNFSAKNNAWCAHEIHFLIFNFQLAVCFRWLSYTNEWHSLLKILHWSTEGCSWREQCWRSIVANSKSQGPVDPIDKRTISTKYVHS